MGESLFYSPLDIFYKDEDFMSSRKDGMGLLDSGSMMRPFDIITSVIYYVGVGGKASLVPFPFE